MKSIALPEFWERYAALPKETRQQARKAFRLWQENPQHPGLRFKRVSHPEEIYSIRISRSHRALALKQGDGFVWFWIGADDEYDGRSHD